MAFSCGPEPDVSVAWVEAGSEFGLGRRFDGGIWIRREAAAAWAEKWQKASREEIVSLILD